MAVETSEKTEIENLFLDSVDEYKKESFKLKGKSVKNVGESVPGTIIDLVVGNKDALISVFEDMFGADKASKLGSGLRPDTSAYFSSSTTAAN